MKIKVLDQSNWNEQDYHIYRLLSRMSGLGGFLDNNAYLIHFNKEKPSESFILKESL